MAIEDGLGQEVHQFLLHEALDRTGAIGRLVTLCAHILFKFLCEAYGHSIL